MQSKSVRDQKNNEIMSSMQTTRKKIRCINSFWAKAFHDLNDD